MIQFLRDTYTVLWADLRVLRHRITRTLATSLMTPILYLLAFGYGLGRGITFNGYNYLDFVIPGIIALTAMTNSFAGAGSKLHVDRLFYKCFDELLMAPISTGAIVLGKALIGVIRGLISSLVMFAAGAIASPKLLFSPLLPMFMFALFLSCLTFAFLGELIGLTAKSHEDMSTFSNLILLPMTFLSGTFFSLDAVPEILRTALYFLPLTHSSMCLRAAALNQPFPWVSLAALGICCLTFSLACMISIRRHSS